MLNKNIQNALNEQINAEMYSAYLYLAMQAHCAANGLPGCAHWMRCQFQEEMVHALKLYDFINDRGGRVDLTAIAAPPAAWQSPLEVFEETYRHEQKVTGLINTLVSLAIQESDHATVNFLQWFVAEQVEEEASASAIVGRLTMIGASGGALFQLDKELGQRVVAPPQPVQ
jgi:ferritin